MPPHASNTMQSAAKSSNLRRGEFLRGKRFKQIRKPAQAGAAVSRTVRHRDLSLSLLQRPPGAVAEGQFLASCTRCGDCVTACPPNAIVWAPPEAGERRAGTPFIEPIRQACVMCIDTPCISACEPGVLRKELPLTMATARIDTEACLPYQGQPCQLCVDQCPVDGAMSQDEVGRPQINADACTGCGVCLQVCPAPRNAIVHQPLASRPFWHG